MNLLETQEQAKGKFTLLQFSLKSILYVCSLQFYNCIFILTILFYHHVITSQLNILLLQLASCYICYQNRKLISIMKFSFLNEQKSI